MISPSDDGAATAQQTVLIVDDQPDLCRIASLLLQRSGFRVLSANDADDAKTLARDNPNIDVLLTDVDMPGTSGDELAAWFRQISPQTEVIFMSGDPAELLQREPCLSVRKPFVDIELLGGTVRQAVDDHAAGRPSSAAA